MDAARNYGRKKEPILAIAQLNCSLGPIMHHQEPGNLIGLNMRVGQVPLPYNVYWGEKK
ncbi:unnamed protein product [Sphenostylis stenocarpa]|uniref:Uncharacterized protein n=1 Tax=Sphenostylis stenocarpa TaxID=92480 RepID=A0AA86S4R3_9FABA|nr:unnamed protein product [Sphenostylis stenocarpa]